MTFMAVAMAHYLDTGEPCAATSCMHGSEGGSRKSACRFRQVTRRLPTLLDGVWFLDLPGTAEKQKIWDLYLKMFEIHKQPLPKDTDWTGAEIRACCRLASLLDVPLSEAARHVVPVAVTAAEQMEKLRAWAAGRCLDASAGGIYTRGAAEPTPISGRRVSRPSAN
jgi:hypothetical protein